VLILRIRQAETAMADGRLDEAYALAQDARLRAHRRGQTLIGRLSRALIERGRHHLAEARWAQAQADCEKAAKLGGNLTEAAELRQSITDAVARHQGEVNRRADVLAAARMQLDKGQLSLCEKLLAGTAGSTMRVARLADRAAAARDAAAHHLDRARRIVELGDWEMAVEHLAEARRYHPNDHAVEELAGRVIKALIEQVRETFAAGRLDRAVRLLEKVEPLAPDRATVAEWRSALLRCRQAKACLGRGAFRTAGEYLQSIAPLMGDVEWLSEAVESARQVAERVERLGGGPLSLLAEGTAEFPERAAETMMREPSCNKARDEPAHDTVRAASGGPTLPDRFLLHVDGAGSYVVVRKRCVTVGPISAPQRPDVGLLAEAALPVVEFARIDEDYFVSADTPLLVNNAPFTRKLLSNGDTIALSARGRLKFAMPNAASATAVVRMAGLRLPSGDAREVILLDHALVIGPGAAAHIRMDALTAPIVLHVHDGRLVCRSGPEVIVGDHALGHGRGIPLDAHVRIGGASFTMTGMPQG